MNDVYIGQKVTINRPDHEAHGWEGTVKYSSMAVGMWGVEFKDGRGMWISQLDLLPAKNDGTDAGAN